MNDLLDQAETVPAKQESTELSAPTTGNFLSVIGDMAKNPEVDPQKMQGLLDVQMRMMDKDAEIKFNSALMELQEELPRIGKDAKIVHNGKLIAKYATYEKIDDVIRPLLRKHNFALRFNTKVVDKQIIITATLSHKAGHSITDEIPLTIDTSGAKNNVQGVGSTIAYGKRYLVGMLLNLVFEGEDDDGQAADFVPLSQQQMEQIEDMIAATDTDEAKFLDYIGVESLEKMHAKDYDRAMIALNRKVKK